jgi:hypothetical protein
MVKGQGQRGKGAKGQRDKEAERQRKSQISSQIGESEISEI